MVSKYGLKITRKIANHALSDRTLNRKVDSHLLPAKSLWHLDQGLLVTSHAAQGRTVDQVLVSVPISVRPKSEAWAKKGELILQLRAVFRTATF